MRFDDAAVLLEQHHAAFADEMPHLLGGRGRLLLAHLDGQAVGLVALKPVDAQAAEVKRLYVRPSARGRGVARALMQRLVDDARDEGFATLRLETASFMAAAHALYRSLGFTESEALEQSEARAAGVERHTHALQLALRPQQQAAGAPRRLSGAVRAAPRSGSAPTPSAARAPG